MKLTTLSIADRLERIEQKLDRLLADGKYISVSEAAKISGASVSAVYWKIQNDRDIKLDEDYIIEGGKYLISRPSLRKFVTMAARTATATKVKQCRK